MDMEKKDLKLDVLVRHDPDRGVYVAQCLQLDITVQAPSMDKLKERFSHAFGAYVMLLRETDDVSKAIRSAPRPYWELFLTGNVDERDLPIFVPAEAKSRVGSVRATFSVTKRVAPLEAASP